MGDEIEYGRKNNRNYNVQKKLSNNECVYWRICRNWKNKNGPAKETKYPKKHSHMG